MKKLLSVLIAFCFLVISFFISKSVTENFQEKAIISALNNDKYTAEEYEEFQQLLSEKTFYYYNNLTEEQKDAYTTLYFSVLNFDKSCKIKVSEDDLKTILYAIIYDNSDIFWLSGNYTYYDHAEFIELLPEYKYEKEDAETNLKELRSKISEIVLNIPSYATEYEKELYIHDYICENTVYDEATLGNGGETAYSSLLEGKSICEGYARAMQILLDEVGIKNYLVVGDATSAGVTEAHMWNIVNINGCNYHLDVTWDDGVFEDELSYFYFNVDDEYILRDHSNLEPKENNCKYDYANYFVMNNTYVGVFSGFSNLVDETAEALKNGKNSVGFLFSNSTEFKRAMNEFNNNSVFFNYVKNSVEKSGRSFSHYNVDYYTTDDYNYLCIIFKED